ncbi:hypothetical protein QE152_g38939 [Popillia japonica]|uniref:Siphovirus-type tail component RIFT-related domain-containing protein n=1 Tax=Popillia japonica TaxID=7064 RepID=A0AAW1HW11_POPJA
MGKRTPAHPRAGYNIFYNGKSGKEIGVWVKERPPIPAPVLRTETITVPGRDGNLHRKTREIEDITISVEFGFNAPENMWQETFRSAKRWLSSEGNGLLVMSDNAEYYYKAKTVTIGESEREARVFGAFTVDFVCAGGHYPVSGQRIYSNIEDVDYNPGFMCKPIYYITGEGMCTLTVNGNAVTANVGQNVTINTELMIAYREDGTIANTSITGDYEDLYMEEGDNTITITSGFTLTIKPNWSNNGDMVLFPTKCELSQVLKGVWELQMEHPIDPDDRWKSIEENGVISAVTPQGKQLFRIDNRKKISVVAYPIFFDSADEIFMVDTRPTIKTGKEALDLMLGGSAKYTAQSNISTATTAYYIRKNFMEALNGDDDNAFLNRWGGKNFMEALNGDDDNAFLNRWGGEPIYDNYNVIVNEKAGGDYGVRVLYGKNLEGAEEEIDYSEIVTCQTLRIRI